MEPWDGPASIAFTDGTLIGAVLDRNGLRPSRYYVTNDDLVIMASEVGVLDIPAANIRIKERLHPGRILLVDTAQGRIIADEEIKSDRAGASPTPNGCATIWCASKTCRRRPTCRRPTTTPSFAGSSAFGYTQEDVKLVLGPMAAPGKSRSVDGDRHAARGALRAAAAALRLLQAALRAGDEPAARRDPRGARHVDGVDGRSRGQPARPRPESCRQINITYPIIDNDQLAKLRHITLRGFESVTLPMLFRRCRRAGPRARARRAARRRQRGGQRRPHHPDSLGPRRQRRRAPIPSLLATAAVHHHLVREGTRTRCGLVVESGDAREVHHVALLVGYGAGAVNPYLAFETLDDLIRQHVLEGITARARGLELHQGAQQGNPEGDVEDGHLDAAELLRRADLRGDRARPGVRRSLLHLNRLTDRRRRHRSHRRRSAPAARQRAFPTRPGAPAIWTWRRVPVAPRRRAPSLQSGDGLQAPARDAHRAVQRSIAITQRS